MKLIHLEDDPLYAEYIHLELFDCAATSRIDLEISHIRTERQFREELDTILENGDAFLLDVMVRWCFPEDDQTAKDDQTVDDGPGEGYYDAGLRCAKLLLEKLPHKRPCVILLYTVYQRDEIVAEMNALEAIRGVHSLKILTKGEEMDEVWLTLTNPNQKF